MSERPHNNNEEEPVSVEQLKSRALDLMEEYHDYMIDRPVGIPEDSQAVTLTLDSDQGRVNIMSGYGPKGHYLQGMHVSINRYNSDDKTRRTRSWNINDQTGEVTYSDRFEYEGDIPEAPLFEELDEMSEDEFADKITQDALNALAHAESLVASRDLEKKLGLNDQPATQEQLHDLSDILDEPLSPVEYPRF